MTQGWNGTMDQLESYLKTLQRFCSCKTSPAHAREGGHPAQSRRVERFSWIPAYAE
jgi:hypothetical protein